MNEYVKSSPKWKKINRIEQKNRQLALEFFKFSDQLIRIKNAVDATLAEIQQERPIDLSDPVRGGGSLSKKSTRKSPFGSPKPANPQGLSSPKIDKSALCNSKLNSNTYQPSKTPQSFRNNNEPDDLLVSPTLNSEKGADPPSMELIEQQFSETQKTPAKGNNIDAKLEKMYEQILDTDLPDVPDTAENLHMQEILFPSP